MAQMLIDPMGSLQRPSLGIARILAPVKCVATDARVRRLPRVGPALDLLASQFSKRLKGLRRESLISAEVSCNLALADGFASCTFEIKGPFLCWTLAVPYARKNIDLKPNAFVRRPQKFGRLRSFGK
jgi:hypothetical protein